MSLLSLTRHRPPDQSSTVPKSFRIVALIVVSAICAAPLRAELIPSVRLSDWTPGVSVGVPGGIPTNRTRLIDVTNAPYNADRSGLNDAQPAIQAAVNAALENDVVYIPSGTYRLNSPVSTGYKDKITIRGAGPNATFINYNASWGSAFAIGGNGDYPWTYKRPRVVGSPKKGSTTLTLSDTSVLKEYPNGGIGALCQITLENDEALPVVHVSGYQRMRKQMSRITAVTSTTVTISPGLHFDLPESLSPLIAIAGKQAEFVGLEDLSIDASLSKTPSCIIDFTQAYGSWARNLRVVKTPNYLLGIGDSLQCEIRECDLRDRQNSGTNGAGLLIGTATGCLIEDNIIVNIFPHIEINAGCTGNVIAYNFCEKNNIFGVMGVSIDSNHGPHNSYNLFEGNIASKFQSDGYFGGESEATLFRNWFHATSETTDQFGICIYLNRLARNFNIVGNILGRAGNDPFSGKPLVYRYDNNWGETTGWGGFGYNERFIYIFGLPNMGSGGFSGKGPPWSNGEKKGAGTLSQTGNNVTVSVPMFSPNDVGKWIYINDGRGMSGAGDSTMIKSYIDPSRVTVAGTYTYTNVPYSVFPGANGFQEIDLDVEATTIKRANYNYKDRAIPANEALNNENLPASLYRSVKPAWFGSLNLPAFDPTAATPNPSYASIPAGYRYLNGGATPGLSAEPSGTPPNNVRVKIGGY